MIIERVFEAAEHEEYGGMGWRPVDMPHADPLLGIAIPHDMLEHAPYDDGSIAAELRALGACYWLRGEGGWFRCGGPVENLASDFVDLFSHHAYEAFPLHHCTYSGEVEPDMLDIARAGARMIISERLDDDPNAEELRCAQEWCTDRGIANAARWLQRGYDEAVERYAHTDRATLLKAFKALTSQASREPEHGEKVKAWVNTETGDCG